MTKELTWDDLAKLYDARRSSGRPARTLPLETVAEWAETQPDIEVTEDGSFVMKKQEAS